MGIVILSQVNCYYTINRSIGNLNIATTIAITTFSSLWQWFFTIHHNTRGTICDCKNQFGILRDIGKI